MSGSVKLITLRNREIFTFAPGGQVGRYWVCDDFGSQEFERSAYQLDRNGARIGGLIGFDISSQVISGGLG